MLAEDIYKYHKRTIKRYDNTRDKRLICVKWVVPCIMNIHNWLGEKCVHSILQMFFPTLNSREGTSPEECAGTDNKYQKNGSLHSQSTWKCPLTTDRNTCADFSFSDGKTKKLMDNILLIISDVFNSGEF